MWLVKPAGLRFGWYGCDANFAVPGDPLTLVSGMVGVLDWLAVPVDALSDLPLDPQPAIATTPIIEAKMSPRMKPPRQLMRES
jgi:hypothetical protein